MTLPEFEQNRFDRLLLSSCYAQTVNLLSDLAVRAGKTWSFHLSPPTRQVNDYGTLSCRELTKEEVLDGEIGRTSGSREQRDGRGLETTSLGDDME